ncbi:MAG: 2-dehydropantoate 2-reductase [Candidatus Obscuribacterales bacterium]|nr:2-dehydropantoate 2-reductase [Candidatus Obscuribacterales bacterium]
MKFAIFGTGGVGAVFGARLAASGEDVTFVARGSHLETIQKNGLLVKSAELGDTRIYPARALSRLEDSDYDFIFLTVKLWDTAQAIEAIRPVVSNKTAIISFQNGVTKDELLADAYGADRILGGISYVGATILEPGVIQQNGVVQKLVFGELNRIDSMASERCQKLKQSLEKAGVEARISKDITSDIWQKFIVLVAMSSVTAATRQSIGVVRSNVQTRALLLSVMSEVRALAISRGIVLPDNIIEDRMQYLDSLSPDVTASMEYDLRMGNRLELPWLAGAVVDMAAAAQPPLEVPTCKILSAVLSPFVRGKSNQ